VGERDQPAFGGGIRFSVRLRHQRAGRGDGDDGATRGAQRLLGGAGEQIGGGQVGVQDLAPVGERERPQRLPHHDAGIGDEPIEPAEFVGHRAYGAPCGFFVADVTLDQGNTAALAGIAAFQSRAGKIDDADAKTIVQEPLRDRPADAVGGSGDERDRSLAASHGSGFRFGLDREIDPRSPFRP
jgi:hypothetical protein